MRPGHRRNGVPQPGQLERDVGRAAAGVRDERAAPRSPDRVDECLPDGDEHRRQAPVLLPRAVDGVRPCSTSASRVARAPRSYSEVRAAR